LRLREYVAVLTRDYVTQQVLLRLKSNVFVFIARESGKKILGWG